MVSSLCPWRCILISVLERLLLCRSGEKLRLRAISLNAITNVTAFNFTHYVYESLTSHHHTIFVAEIFSASLLYPMTHTHMRTPSLSMDGGDAEVRSQLGCICNLL